MKNLLIVVLFWGILSTCNHSGRELKPGTNLSFQTTPPSRLYFKNIRSVHYDLQRQPGTRIDLYQLRRFTKTTQRPVLYPVIADNWMQDEAYLLLRPNDFELGFSDTLRVFWKSGRDSGRYELPAATRSDQFRLAEQLYQSIQQEHQLAVETASGTRALLFEKKKDRLHFSTTLRDYYRLTEQSDK